MKVCDEVIAVLSLPIERRDGMTNARESADKELQQRCDAVKHRCGKSHTAPNHRGAPVEKLHSGWNGDEHASRDKEQIDRVSEPDRKHVMSPDEQTQKDDDHSRSLHELVAKEQYPRENQDHFRQDRKRRDRDDINFRMPKRPENMLPQDG